MKDQHKKIKGYRNLSQDEIDLMNRIKEQGACLESMLQDLLYLPETDLTEEQVENREECLSYATKDLKQGIMWTVRAVALPDSF